jgi:hypothetical protein
MALPISAAQTAARTLAAGTQPGAAPAAGAGGLPAGVHEVQRVAAPGGGFYVLGSDGGVFALPDASGKTPAYYGSVPGLQGDALAGQHQFASGGLSLNPTGGYTLTDSAGRQYGFDTGYANSRGYAVPAQGNTLNADPATLAFLRASGLGEETAANDVNRRAGAINAALATSIGDLNNSADEGARRTQGGFESRGILRSSDTNQALDQAERARATAESNARQTAAGQIADLHTGLMNQILANRNHAAELGATTAQSQDADANLTRLKTQYPDAFATTSGMSS